jgi:uracil-DNA glycosylase
VREGSPNSHKGKGWEIFTDRVIGELNKKSSPIVFLLWGANAKNKAKIINNPIHKKLETVHPSPLSAYGGFFGCKHFSTCNKILAQSGQKPIDWQI